MKNLAGVAIGSGMKPSRTRFARFLRKRRLELELTQVEMAKRARMAQSHYSGFEIGLYRFIQPYNLRRLAGATRIKVIKLQALVPKRHEPKPKTKLGWLILSRRTKLGLSRKELAKRSRMPVETLYGLEIGESAKLLPRTALKLARGLEVSHSAFKNFIVSSRTAASSAMGRTIKASRVQLLLSQADLAKKIRKTRAYVSLVEAGGISLSSGGYPLMAFAKALKLRVGTLAAHQPKRKLKEIATRPGSFARLLVQSRHALGLNQTMMAKRLQTNKTNLSAWEHGHHLPHRTTHARLAAQLTPATA